MKNWLKENGPKLVLALAVLAAIFLMGSNKGYVNNPFENSYTSNDPLSSELIVCRFDVTANFSRNGNDGDVSESKIEYSIEKQSEPVTLTFANLSSKNPMMKGNGGEVPLVVITNDDEKILLAEQSAYGDAFFYTIFKKEKTAVWQKAYLLIKTPFALVSMGYCN